jgi:hypothetical protein
MRYTMLNPIPEEQARRGWPSPSPKFLAPIHHPIQPYATNEIRRKIEKSLKPPKLNHKLIAYPKDSPKLKNILLR